MLLGIFCTNLSFFNTASGMDCMQFCNAGHISYVEFEFQYRKRYGLHAIRLIPFLRTNSESFNTASGMDCMQ